MQKGDSAKLKLLLAGISARLTKNRDFFVQADCTLVSGKKKFDAKLSRADEDYTLHFQGSDRRVDAAEFCAFFAEQAEKYDESVLTYTERSTVVTLSVTARGVQMKQAEREATAEEKAAAANPLLDSGRQYLIRVDQAAALLREIGILTADGKLKNDMIRKYNQIDHYVELVAPTDSMRALKLEAEGYKVSVVEYISPLDTPKNLLIRATRTGKVNHRAKAEYDAVRRTLGTTSELDRRCAELDNEFFVTDEDLMG